TKQKEGKGPVARMQPVPQAFGGGKGDAKKVLELARKDDDRGKQSSYYAEKDLKEKAAEESKDKSGKGENKTNTRALEQKNAYDEARKRFAKRDKEGVQAGKLGVDLAVNTQNLRTQCRLDRSAVRNVNGRQCLEVGG